MLDDPLICSRDRIAHALCAPPARHVDSGIARQHSRAADLVRGHLHDVAITILALTSKTLQSLHPRRISAHASEMPDLTLRINDRASREENSIVCTIFQNYIAPSNSTRLSPLAINNGVFRALAADNMSAVASDDDGRPKIPPNPAAFTDLKYYAGPRWFCRRKALRLGYSGRRPCCHGVYSSGSVCCNRRPSC